MFCGNYRPYFHFSYSLLKLFDLNGCKLYINFMTDHPPIGIFEVSSIFTN